MEGHFKKHATIMRFHEQRFEKKKLNPQTRKEKFESSTFA